MACWMVGLLTTFSLRERSTFMNPSCSPCLRLSCIHYLLMNPIMLNLLNVVVVLVPISFCYLKLEMSITLEYSWNSEEPLK